MKILFTGSDVQLLNEFPAQLPRYKIIYVLLYRLFIRVSSFCTEEYSVVHDHLIPELKRFGIKKNIVVFSHPVKHTRKYPRFPHKKFNILYYCPTGDDKWNKWIYGYDIYQRVKEHYKDEDIHFIRSYGQFDMSLIYPVTDFYLRPNRHDGSALMVLECEIQKIPYYWSWENPDFDDIIKSIDDARRRKINN